MARKRRTFAKEFELGVLVEFAAGATIRPNGSKARDRAEARRLLAPGAQ
jgi:hypothetical protein